MPVGHLYIFFGEMSVQIFSPFLIGLLAFLLLRCMSSLYILDINPLSDIRFASIFSQLLGCVLVLWMVSFAVQKIFLL